PAIGLQKEGETFYFIAAYHALTSVRDPKTLRENSIRVSLDFLACGLDPERAALFRQSDVPQVTELAWILSTVAPTGLLERAHSYKDKLARGLAPTVGLFSYPVLMAADILIYDSDAVPVGKDQRQHIEITRDLAVKINEAYGNVFKLPEPRSNPARQIVHRQCARPRRQARQRNRQSSHAARPRRSRAALITDRQLASASARLLGDKQIAATVCRWRHCGFTSFQMRRSATSR